MNCGGAMKFTNKMLTWIAIGSISIGSINTLAAHMGIIAEEKAYFTKENGVKEILKMGDKVNVILDKNDYQSDRVKAEIDGTYGYVDAKDIQIRQVKTEVLEDDVPLEKFPNEEREVISRLNKGELVTAFYKYIDWYFIETVGGHKGYIYKDYINEESLYLLQRKDIHLVNNTSQAPKSPDVKGEFYIKESINKDPEATNNIAVIAKKTATLTTQEGETVLLGTGDRIKMILDENFHSSDVAQVDMMGAYGYIAKSDIQMKQIQTRISTDGALLRENPDPRATVVQTLNKDQLVTAYYKYVDWYFIELESGEEGFIYKTQINENKLYLLKRVNTLNQLNALIGREPAVEVVMWNEASGLLPRGGNAIIEDVYTGKRFGIKRTFGTNHADIETLTKADTQIMKEIWGGFTWERRPVIVHVAGRRLAASMAGMPHAGKDSAPSSVYTSGRSAGYGYGINLDAVKGNGMDGHVDLHFRGSRRHADGKITATVDSLHQAAIDVAARQK